jgi:hypothetical protein
MRAEGIAKKFALAFFLFAVFIIHCLVLIERNRLLFFKLNYCLKIFLFSIINCLTFLLPFVRIGLQPNLRGAELTAVLHALSRVIGEKYVGF